jgi:hypothetical protein
MIGLQELNFLLEENKQKRLELEAEERVIKRLIDFVRSQVEQEKQSEDLTEQTSLYQDGNTLV